MFDYSFLRSAAKDAADKRMRIETEKAETKARQQIIAHRKNSLRAALNTGEAQYIYNWCYTRALEKKQREAQRNAAKGLKPQRLSDEEVLIVQNNWHKWYYRICRWWDIDHGWGKPN